MIPDLAPVGAELARVGVVGCTDATPWATAAELAAFTAALSAARLPQRVLTMAGPGVVAAGPVKVVLGDHDLPALGEIEQWFAEAHDAGRPVAVHCVTAAALALSIAAWDAAGAHPGDRVEHAAVVSTTAIDVLAGLGVRVVTQPALVVERGDRYLARVPAGEHDELWRCASLLAGGVRVAAGSDCPYGPLDPWAAMRGAVTRSTAGGRVLGIAERVAPATALELFLSELDDAGGPPRRVRVGARADVCVLDAPLPDVLAEPDAGRVVATVIGGRVVHPS